MTTSARETFLVRAPGEFCSIKGPGDWLEAYKYTRDLASLLGLLHVGADFTDNSRILDVYLTYCRLAGEYTDTADFQIKKKTRSVFYHEILPRFACPNVFTLSSEAATFLTERAGHIARILAFFDSPCSFPLGKPFAGDVMNFMYGYATYLPILMASAPNQESRNGILQDEILRSVVQALVAAIVPFRWEGQLGSCEGGEIGYYEALVRKVAEHDFVKELVMRTLRKDLKKILPVSVPARELLWAAGVEHGGIARRLGLLLHDIEQRAAAPKTS